MNHSHKLMFAALAVACGAFGRPGFAAPPAPDLAAAETAVRKADAAWAAAASSGNVDAWMAYSAPDAVVLLPNEPLASGADAVRHVAVRLLTSPHASIEWHAVKIELAPTGDLAHVQGVYQFEHDGAGGTLVTDRGRLVEIWKRQADGAWKCAVDSWTPDVLAAGAAAAPAPALQFTAPPASVPQVPTPPAMPAPLTKYGDAPVNYLQVIRQYFQEHLKDPESIQYQEITKPEQGEVSGVSGGLLMHDRRDYGWIVKATINARNSHGTYVGLKTYKFLFRGEKMLRATAPLPDDEMVN